MCYAALLIEEACCGRRGNVDKDKDALRLEYINIDPIRLYNQVIKCKI